MNFRIRYNYTKKIIFNYFRKVIKLNFTQFKKTLQKQIKIIFFYT